MRTQAQPTTADVDGLLKEYFETRDRGVRDRIVEAHLYIVSIIARKFSGRGVDYDDLYQVAALALTKALDRFNPDHGVKFASFVTPCMVGEVKNYFRDKSRIIRAPRRSADAQRIVAQSIDRLTQVLRRSPRVDEVAQDTGLAEDIVLEALDAGILHPVSLDQQLAAEDADYTLEKALGTEEAGYSSFETEDMLSRAMDKLTEAQQKLVQLRFFENRSQKDTSDVLGVSQMTVSRMERKILALLRKEIKDED